MAKKHYEVLVEASAMVVVVDAEDEEKAIEYAKQELSSGDFEIDNISVERELKPSELESAKRHATVVALPDPE